MDSDGTCMKNGCSCFNTKSKQLAEDIKILVLSLGGFAKVREKRAKYFNKKYNEIRDCGTHYEVTITLCDSSIPIFRLKRKQDRVVYRTLRSDERFFDRVEKSRICDGQCIKVDAEDELYLTDNFIVTHNTSLTTAMASHAACSGYKVLQIVFEDRIKQIQRKHLGRITGIEAKDLSKPENIDRVKETIENFPDKYKLNENLRIVKFPSGEKTARQIERFIKKLINSGFKPDLTIIDYFECLEHENDRSTTNEFSQEGKTMRRFEAMAGELDMAIWIPSQGTKDSINLELVTMDKIGGSVKKAQIAHVIMSIARTVDDIANNKATIAILKNRAGKSGKVFNNVEFNNGTCRISTDNVDELDSLFELKKKQEDMRLNTQKEIFMSVRNEKK
jgi:predicted peroxiredoxin